MSGGMIIIDTSAFADTVMTTNGDMIYYNGGRARLPKGSDGEILELSGGFPSWQTAGGGGKSLLVACSDEDTAISSIGEKISFRMPEAMTLNSGITGVKGSLVTAGTGANLFTVDIRDQANASSSTTEAGATADSNSATTYITYKQITGLTAGDKITAVTFDAYSYTSTSFKCGVYSDNSNQPQTLLGSGTIASGSLVNTYTTVQCTLDTPVIATSDKVWVAMIMDTNTVTLRVTSEPASYTNSVYATTSTPSGSYTNYANMLYSTANISGNGGNNIRSGVVIEDSSILSTPLTFDSTETTSITAVTPVVISDTSLSADADLSIHVIGLDSGNVASGLKVALMGV